jgi:hypothetical protein
MVSAVDETVKNITDALKEAGMYDDTLLVFATGELPTPYVRSLPHLLPPTPTPCRCCLQPANYHLSILTACAIQIMAAQ